MKAGDIAKLTNFAPSLNGLRVRVLEACNWQELYVVELVDAPKGIFSLLYKGDRLTVRGSELKPSAPQQTKG